MKTCFKNENLDLLLKNLEHSFDVISVSETIKDNQFINLTRSLLGYQKYHSTEKKNCIKSGCGFYIKENKKCKPRGGLNVDHVGNKNDFQSYWIEILLDNNPNIVIGVFYIHPKKTSDNTSRGGSREF